MIKPWRLLSVFLALALAAVLLSIPVLAHSLSSPTPAPVIQTKPLAFVAPSRPTRQTNSSIAQTAPPTASFQSNAPVCLGETISFSNTTTGTPPIDYLWDLGDGVTSTLESPTHTYALDGVYTVTLLAKNPYGSSTATDTVEIKSPPLASFEASTYLLTTTFTNTSRNAETYVWDFGDGVTTTVEHPQHVYADAGVYTVALQAIGDCGSGVFSDTVSTCTCHCLDGITILGPTVVDPGFYYFRTSYSPTYATPPINYRWDDGSTSEFSARSFSSADLGPHTLTVTATNCLSDTSQEGAIVTDSHTITVVAADIEVTPPLVEVEVPPGETYTTNLTVSNAGNADLSWNLPPTLPVAWLSASPASGTLTPASHTDVALFFDATELTTDTYTTILSITSTDLDEPILNVPITFTVRQCVEITGVSLRLETGGPFFVDFPVYWNAALSPDDLSTPYTYTVNYGDSTLAVPGTHTQNPLVLSHTYTAVGSYTIEISAWNCQMTASLAATDSLEVFVYPERPYALYLPLVIKNDQARGPLPSR